MRIITLAICVCALLKTAAFGQTVIIDEGFDDGDFTGNPTWTDPESKHIVNSSNLLQLDAPGVTDEAIISTPSNAAYGEWEAYIQLGFNPSGSNRAKFYVNSDTQNMKGSVNGYYIMIGDTPEEISLYRQDGNSDTIIIDGADGLIDNNPVMVHVRLTRDLDGNWELFADPSGGTSYTSQGTATDNTYGTSSFIGFLSDYSSTRSDLFEYDDIKITKINPPLEIQNIVVQNNTTIDVQFNLAIDPASIDAADFSLDNGIGSPNSTSLSSPNVVRLSYNSPLTNNRYTLTVDNIDDTDGNTISPNSTIPFTVFGEFSSGDVIINEFAYDAPGSQSEFVELKNTSGKLLNLQNWQIGEGSGTITISSSEVILQPNDYLVISSDTMALFNVYGSCSYVETDVGNLNNDTDYITILNDNGTQIDSLQYTSAWGGNNISLERRSDTAPSIYRQNFGDSPNPDGGTPGLPNEVADDTKPPDFNNLIITNNQRIDLDFSERLENGNATNTTNYTLNNGITINNAQQTAGDSVRLNLSQSLQNGMEYQLTINNQQDIFGNIAAQTDSSFTYYEPTPADSGDIFINEFMYDPPGSSSEYIELYNPTNESFDLKGWTINDNNGNPQTITNRQFIIPPDSFVVIAPNQALLQNNPEIELVPMGNNFPSLNNSGDDIVLRDDTGKRLDSLTYNATWGGSEVALERRTTTVEPIQANFGDAPNGFGTPGEANQIPQDKTPPNIDAFSIIDNQLLQFVYTEQVEKQSATNTANYSLSGGIMVSNITLSGGDTLSVNLSSPLQNNTQYTATIDGVDDLFSNTLSNRDTTFMYYEVSPADSGDIFINEFTYDPPTGSTEYIELYNTSNKSLDLQNWTINDNRGTQRTITNSQFIVPPDSFVVIAPDQTLLNGYPDIALVTMGSNFPGLNNGDDDIVLRDGTGERLDSLTYSDSWGGNEIALERRTTNVNPIQANFGNAPNGFGTPGSQNEIPQDNTPPGLSDLIIVSNQTLNLAFTKTLNSNEATNPGNYTLNIEATVNSAWQTAPDSVQLNLSSPLQNATEYDLTISNQQDVFGNTTASIDTSFTFYEVSPIDSGEVFINEFTYDPPTGSTEYIELHNPTPQSFDLNGWTINDNTGNTKIITNSSFILPPDSFVVIAPDKTLLNQNPDIALVVMGNNFPSLNNSGDDIVLRDSTGQRLDSLTYTSGWGGDQVSLERRTTDVAPIKTNFGSTPNDFGTPGQQNQISQDNTPPKIATVDVLERQILNVAFSEVITGANTTDQNNYAIDNGISINSIQQTAEDSVQLTLDNSLQNGITYQLTVTNQQDIFGNTNASTTASFQFTDDTTPPELDELIVVGDQTIDLNFSEQMTSGAAGDKTNYSLSNGIIVSGAQQTAGDSVRLSLASPLQNATEYDLTISNQQDVFGNTAASIDTSFTFYEVSPVDSGDVFINEFTYDPPTGSTEYIELYNTTSQSFDLKDWSINDNTGNPQTITNSSFILPPDSFVIIAPDQTLLNDNADIALVVMASNFPSLNNSGDDIVLRNDSGEQLDSLRYNSTFGGNNIAVERRTVNTPPVQANFGDAPNGFGTPGSANQIPQDNTSPNLTNLGIQDNQILNLAFSEGLDSGPAITSGNYSIDNGITVSSAQQFAPDSVRLILSSVLQNGVNYQLTVNNQQDIFGNTAAALDTSFTYFETSAADSGDIFINEFVYNPVGGSTEYIELYNTTPQSFDLDGWTINDNSGHPQMITNSHFIVPPDSFVVIAPDQTILQDNPGIALVAMGSSFPSLNNSGDAIVLRNANGLRLDSLTYTSNWGGNNIALERRTTDVGPFQSNFVDAPNGKGTPGRQNQAPADNSPPEVQTFSIISNQSLEFVFTEQLDSQSATNTDNYKLSGDITIGSTSLLGDTVRVKLSGALQNNTEYTATVNGVSDIFGNTMTDRDTTFTYFEVSNADTGDIFINEFTYDPPEGSTEYIELFNPTGRSYNLNGWTINDNTSNRRTITNNQYILPPNSFVVIAPDQTLQQDNPNIALIAMGNRFPSLNNSGDDIVLRNVGGQRLDSLQYSSAWGGNNVALERRTTDVSPFRSNFGNASNGFGTPGASNEISDDTTPPDIAAFSIVDNQLLEFVFSEEIEDASATDPNTYALSSDITIDNAFLTGDNTVRLNLSAPLENNVSYTATISGLSDLFGNTLSNRDTTFNYFEVATVNTGDVFINEFTYDPPAGSTEYIEIANPTSRSFNLEGWTVNDNTGNRRVITDQQFIVPPNSFVVIAPDQTLLQENPDIALITMPRFPSLNNGSDDIVLCDSTGQQLDSLTYNSDWGGSEVALERRTTEVAPIHANFGNAPNGFGTPGQQNRIDTDNTPPRLESFAILGSQSLQFVYTEQVERSSATNTDSYTLSGGIAVNSATLSGTDTVRISLSDPLQNNTDYTASVNGINDPFGNTLTNRDTTFTYFEVSAADSGDVFINEFVYDPPSGQTEYIELFNPTNRSLNLRNWTINDNTASRQTITDNQYIVPPNSRVVIAPDPTLLQNYPEISLVIMGSRFPSLNNSGDDIVLRDGNEQLLDSLRYTSAWGGNEIALERRTINVDPVQANFGDSPSGFGTPGSINDIPADDQPPVLTALRILDNSKFRLFFSESITGETATQKSNYSISPNPGIQLISAVQDTVTLFLSQELQSEQTYQVTVRGLMDLFGNTIAKTSESQPYVQYSDAQPGNILINEFLYTRESAGDPEFVELFNPTDQNFDLSGWKIGDTSGTATIDAGVQLRRGSYLVLTDNPSLANVLDNGLYLSNFPSLNDDQDIIYLQDDRGITIDSLSYSPAFGGTVDGKSTERKDPQAASNDPSNFGTSTAKDGSTPGAQNSVFAPDNTPPDINFARIFPNGDIEVRFSEFISLNEDVQFSINDQSLTVDTFNPDDGNTIFLNTPESIQPGTELTLLTENLTDVSGNTSSTAQISVAQLLRPGDVVINEIMYDPISDSEDNRPDQSEYIELRNTRDYAVSLGGITLHDAADEDGEVRRLTPVSTQSKYIPAQGTALIYADEYIAFKQSQTAHFFKLSDQPKNTLIRLDRSSLSLASTDDAIYLTGNEGVEIDSVFYDESWQNPNLVDTDGIALERISPDGQSNDESNWGSSTNKHGGTPNNENSIFQESGVGNQDNIGISFEPNPFSPDDDGTDDRLFINYKLGQPDYLITVTIYDRYGRRIRELTDSKPAGFEGSLIWDGLKDNGNRNRIGIYIVIFEAFDSASGGNKTFKETVVLARRLN